MSNKTSKTMKKITNSITLFFLLVGTLSFAQTARVQVIHNSPDLAANVVDVYLNGSILLNDFTFRTATPFVTVPAGVQISIDVAPGNSTSVAQSIYNLSPTLTNGATYILVANGIVSPTGYSSAPNFALSVFGQGREVASNPAQTDVLVNHGSPDAPTVDVVETEVPAGTIVNDVSFPSFAGYLELPNLDFTLDVRDATGLTTVASYSAPLQTLGLAGDAITVLASGFLNPAANSNGPGFGLWVATAAGGNLIPLPLANPSTARVQVIHNSPDLAAAVVDVYVNDVLALDDFEFRTATPFIDLPAGAPLSIDVAPGNSTSSAQSLYNLTTTLADGETYIAVANGIVSPTGYSSAPNFALSVFGQGREVASNPAQTDVLVNHGSPDAPTVDVVETAVPAGTIVNDVSFPSFAGYLELPNLDFTLDVRDATGVTTVASYSAPLQTLGLAGDAITVLASGFLNPAANSNGPSFGLWVATAAGGNLIPLPLAVSPTARVQVIHNSPDLAAAVVDVYVNDVLALDDFEFRTATPFIDLPAGSPLSIDVAPGNSTSSAQSLYNLTTTLADGETYIAVANGIVSPTGSSAPNFALSVFGQGREVASNPAQTDVLVNHGSPDAPIVDIVETAVPAGTIVNDVSFPSFAGYLELPNLDFTLDVRDATGLTTVASYSAPLQTLGLAGDAITVLASGFLNPAANSNGPGFGLWVATAAGGDLIPLPTVPLSVNQFSSENIKVYPNPVNTILNIDIPYTFETFEASIIDMNGRIILTNSTINKPIDVSGLVDGIYMLSLKIDANVVTRKIVIAN
jgi:hypothetical protein